MTEIRGFIFDLDGVITDTAELHYQSWKVVADDEGLPFTREDNEQLRGVSRRESLERLLKGHPMSEDKKQAVMTRKNDIYREKLKTITPDDLLPGVRAFLDQARARGIKIGLGSASRNAREVLASLGVTALFDALGDGHSVVNTKPAPDLFLWVAGRLDLNPAQVVVFEDAEAGIDAAKAGGFKSVGIGHASVAHADHVLADGLKNVTPQRIIDLLKGK